VSGSEVGGLVIVGGVDRLPEAVNKVGKSVSE